MAGLLPGETGAQAVGMTEMTLRPRDRRRQESLGTAEQLCSACLELALTLGAALGWPGEAASAVTSASWGEGFWHTHTPSVKSWLGAGF